jgi:hypothetical protein
MKNEKNCSCEYVTEEKKLYAPVREHAARAFQLNPEAWAAIEGEMLGNAR